MDSTEIKLNLLIKKIAHLESLVLLLVKDQNLDPNLIHDLDHSQINKSDLDHDHDLSDEDLVNWFKDFISENGISPDGRDFNSIIRNIRYFRSKYSELTNPVKYALRFLPVQRLKTPTPPEDDDSLILGLDRNLVESNTDKLTSDIIKKLHESDPDLKKLSFSPGQAMKTTFLRNILTAKAIKAKLIDIAGE